MNLICDPGMYGAANVVERWCGSDPLRNAYPGAVAAVAKDGEIILKQVAGAGRIGSTESDPASPLSVCAGAPMQWDSLFDVASLTKPVATTMAALMLMEQGELSGDDTLDLFFPQLRTVPLGQARVWNLLTHTAGFAESTVLFMAGAPDEDPVTVIGRAPLAWAPGSHVQYSCAGFIILGRLIQVTTGYPLDRFVNESVFEPLEMRDTSYLPLSAPLPDRVRGRLIPTEPRSTAERGRDLMAVHGIAKRWSEEEWFSRHLAGDIACGVVHDENAAWLGGVSGNAGVFSTAEDLLKFGQMWLDGGVYNGRPILSHATVRMARRSQTAGLGDDDRGLGWQLPSRDTSFGDFAPLSCFGHTGFTGTGLWIDPENGLVIVLLTNRLQFTRSNEQIGRVRRLFLNAVFSAVR
ncbi:MAG: serine hydrolase domain-containing protein [Clostridia bacterium]|nr:serine hydrolase domain-containing protein [Clostridia bacterium]